MLLMIYDVILYFSSEKQHRNEDKRYPQNNLEHFLPTTYFDHNPRTVMKSQSHIYEKAADKCINHRMPNTACPSTFAEVDMVNGQEHETFILSSVEWRFGLLWTIRTVSRYAEKYAPIISVRLRS